MWASPFTYWATLMVPTLTFLSTYQVGYADASRFQESCFHLPSSKIVSLWYHIWHFKHGFWVSNSGPNAYKIGKHFTKWTNPAPTSYSCWIQGGWGHKTCKVYFTREKAILLFLFGAVRSFPDRMLQPVWAQEIGSSVSQCPGEVCP